ncbi:UDP-xylose transporter 2 [Zea mays]|uniref:UDP-xylose transporter 2 n=1 Tax=Zea mays TaxID=4577 RepID=A0A3L6DJN1_MAIZE|nr:UDP-xylose transporter 2 [Zea mays]
MAPRAGAASPGHCVVGEGREPGAGAVGHGAQYAVRRIRPRTHRHVKDSEKHVLARKALMQHVRYQELGKKLREILIRKISTFLVIGKTSPVTNQVLGHLKTCLVLNFGYVLLHDLFSWRNILGILIAVIVMVLYLYFCTRETHKYQQKPPRKSFRYLSAGTLGLNGAFSKVANFV